MKNNHELDKAYAEVFKIVKGHHYVFIGIDPSSDLPDDTLRAKIRYRKNLSVDTIRIVANTMFKDLEYHLGDFIQTSSNTLSPKDLYEVIKELNKSKIKVAVWMYTKNEYGITFKCDDGLLNEMMYAILMEHLNNDNKLFNEFCENIESNLGE